MNYDENFRNNVIFSKNVQVNFFNSDSKDIVRRTPNTEFNQSNIVPTIKYGGCSIML